MGGEGARGEAATCHFMVTSGMPARCCSTCTSINTGQLTPGPASAVAGPAGTPARCCRLQDRRPALHYEHLRPHSADTSRPHLQLVARHRLCTRQVLFDQHHHRILQSSVHTTSSHARPLLTTDGFCTAHQPSRLSHCPPPCSANPPCHPPPPHSPRPSPRCSAGVGGTPPPCLPETACPRRRRRCRR